MSDTFGTLGYEADLLGLSPESIEVVPVGSLIPHPQNPRRHRIDLIMQSMKIHGQRSPVVVQRSTGTILKGHGTWLAAKQLGWPSIAISRQDFNDDEALAYLLDDNRASDLSRYDRDQHLKALEILMAGPAAQATIWTADDVEDLRESLRPLAELDAALDAQHTNELAGEGGKARQAKRDKDSATERERLKDVRFVLSLDDHAAFIAGLKVLQKAYGTSGAIATIMETVKRAVAGAGGGGDATEFKRQMAAMLYALPGPHVAIAQVLAMLGPIEEVKALAAMPEPEQVPGQLTIDEALEAPAPVERDWSQSSGFTPEPPR